MRTKYHIHLFCLATTLWTIFFFGGLWSDYYQEWHWAWQLLIIDCVPAAVLIYMAPAIIRDSRLTTTTRAATTLAFYFSVPFLVYDFIYLGLFQELSLFYLVDYWYLTMFSLMPWLIFPVAVRINSETENV